MFDTRHLNNDVPTNQEKIKMKTAIITDSNSGITQAEGKALGVRVIPMPFIIENDTYFEDITMSHDEFFAKLTNDVKVTTSQPLPGDIIKVWDEVLEEYDEILYIPMSQGLSHSYNTAKMLAEEYDGKVVVVDNHGISVTQKQSVYDSLKFISEGKNAHEIQEILEAAKYEQSIYIQVATMKYLVRGGRVTPAAAMIGNLIKLKPVLHYFGENFDRFSLTKTMVKAKKVIADAIEKDLETKFKDLRAQGRMCISVAHTQNYEEAKKFAQELAERFPDVPVHYNDCLSLSVSCHIGPGALAAVTCSFHK